MAEARSGRRPTLAALIGATVFVDALLYAALAPLLPRYATEAGLGGSGAALLVAFYPAGIMCGAIPAGHLAGRVGARTTTLAGLLLLAGSSAVFGFATAPALLFACRFVQGLGSAAAWTGGLAWLTATTATGSRGSATGAAIGAAVAGTIFGPVLGVAAATVGTAPAFLAVAAAAAILAVAVAGRPASPVAAQRPRLRDLNGPILIAGLVLICVVGTFIGLVDALVPLRLDELGGSAALIGGVFLFAATLQSAASPALGRIVDSRGIGPVAVLGLAAATMLAALAPFPQEALVLAAIVVIAGPTVGGLWVPGMTLLGLAAGEDGDGAYAFAIGALAWSAAQTLGSGAGGPLAQAGGEALPYLVFAGCAGLLLAAGPAGWLRPPR